MATSSISKKRLRIGIDAHALGSNLGGNETYLRCLLQGLNAHPEHDYVLYVSHSTANRIAGDLLQGAERHQVSPNPLKRLGLDLPLASFRDGLDLIHLQYVSPLLSGCPVSLLIHDLSYEHNPEWFTRGEVARFRATIPRSAKTSHIVMTISEFCREDIIRRLGIPSEKVIVTPNALPPHYKRAETEKIRGLRSRLGIPERYILALGNLQPRKNIISLIRAWRRIMDRPEMKETSLVITGKKAWLFDEILSEAGIGDASGDRIVFTGYLPEEDLPALYSGALLFVYPSLFEGFGLPPIEAMACGTPVILGRHSALAEVCGTAACYTDVTDQAALGETILMLRKDETKRSSLSAEGILHAASYTLERLAAPTVRAWERIARITT
ncbi:MAG: glycosyltransferase family 4 protein [Verrucomicrobia bacterium]|nr:glycosyltransferase family 4 protein [Verrucomicrobiota bacterium]